MVELDLSVESFLDTIDKTVKNEMDFIKLKDWSATEIVKDRNDIHDLQFLLTDRNIKHADKLHKLSTQTECNDHPRVKKMLKSLLAFFDYYEARYEHYTGKQDFSAILSGMATSNVNVKAEIEFQSDLAKNLTTFREIIRRIKLDGDKTKTPVQTFNDTPIPMAMRKSVEKRYPIVTEILTKKLENGSSKK